MTMKWPCHWPTRSELVLDACSRISAEQEVPDTGTFEGDVTVLLTTIADLLQTARWSSVTPSIIDGAERDAALAAIHTGHASACKHPYISVVSTPSATTCKPRS